jgi:hypothetical protein
MLRQVIEEIEQLHADSFIRRDEPLSAEVEERLAHCLQELRAIVARDARDQRKQRPSLQVV